MNQYKFTSRSSLSFVVHHNGRQRYVNFSPAYRNQSYYITNDPTLAEKIRQHRWFKEGRIKEEIVEIKSAKPAPVYKPETPKAPKPYSILGRQMASPKNTVQDTPNDIQNTSNVILSEAKNLNTPNSNEHSDVAKEIINQDPAFSPESVTSFMEAKEFFVSHYGITRSECASKAMLEALCQHYNVQFPNYNP